MVAKASLPARMIGRQGSLSHRQNACLVHSKTVQTFFEPAQALKVQSGDTDPKEGGILLFLLRIE